MQNIQFALRQSTADSVDDNRSRYVPSSIYSGPGPVEDSPPPPHPSHMQFTLGSLNGVDGVHNANAPPHSHSVNGISSSRNTYQSVRTNSYAQPLRDTQFRTSTMLNKNDPVVMHLLAETALSDSRDFEVVSFEELEQLKKDRMVIRNRIDATKRKIALECKLRDAAQSLNRLYTKPNGSMDMKDVDQKGHNRNYTGSKSGNNEALNRANDEYTASALRVERLTRELKNMETRLEDTQRRIIEHTAGILQLTHKGLKKNLRKSELPRSPESMTSPGRHSTSDHDTIDEFDERSLYPIPDYVHEFARSNPVTPVLATSKNFGQGTKESEGVVMQLHNIGMRIHDMVRQITTSEDLTSPPAIGGPQVRRGNDTQVQEQLSYMSTSVDALVAAQKKTLEESENVNARIHKMLEKTNSVGRAPLPEIAEPRCEDLASQLAVSTRVLEQLQNRIETLVGQKDILTRQIQQQRELNTKSDAQRDAQIRDLTEELEETKRFQITAEQESKESQNQMALLIEQLDRAKQDASLMEHQRGMTDNKALQAERDARKTAERQLTDDIAAKQHVNTQLEADMAKLQTDFELRSQQHILQLNDLSSAKESASIEAQKHKSEAEKLLEQMAAIQTELTIVKAELDGAYGTRAQRAADVSLNPAVQKEIDSLSSRNAQLQKELRDTIEDYEQMTKASIEFEKERDRFESLIDKLRERCESLESQLSEEKLKWLGTKTQTPAETTSTMVLKNEFKKMMRDSRTESTKAIRAEQDERRRLEAIIRTMRKEAGLATPAKSTTSSHLSAEPSTPSALR